MTPGPLLPPGVKVGDDWLAQAVIVQGGAEGTPGVRLQGLGGPVEVSPPEVGGEQSRILAHFHQVFGRLWERNRNIISVILSFLLFSLVIEWWMC